MTIKNHLLLKRVTSIVMICFAFMAVILASLDFLTMHSDPPIYPGSGVTDTVHLSRYAEELAGTAADTDLYILEGPQAGGTVLLLGGTHPNEPASSLAAIILIENAVVEQGRIIVIPRANRSAFSCTTPLEGHPQIYTVETAGGRREFRYGSRGTNPVHQWPDPLIYVNSSGQPLTGMEVRNLNRSYPGSESGYLTEKLAQAILNLIREEKVDMAIDLHEASPEYPVVNAIVAHERAMDIAVETSMLLEFEGIEISVEGSPQNLHGLSHREWGDFSDTLAVLMETTNPAQGRLRGRTNRELVMNGKDPYYLRAAEQGLLAVPFTEEGHPMEERVGRHLNTFGLLLEIFGTHQPERSLVVRGLPRLEQLLEDGLGAYLALPPPPGHGASQSQQAGT